MQSLRATRISSIWMPRQVPQLLHARRTYAEVNTRGPGGEASVKKPGDQSAANTSRLPLYVAMGVIAFIPIFYFTQGRVGGAAHGGKPPGAGQATIKELRRQGDPTKEYRDPRDDETKISQQDKIRQEVLQKK